MYERGGKVWTGDNGWGLVFLEKDWDNSRLPQDLVEEAGLLATNFQLLENSERGKLAGYISKEDTISFIVDTQEIANHAKNISVFLACEANDWLSNEGIENNTWKLSQNPEGLSILDISIKEIGLGNKFSFKYKTSDGTWLHPPDFIPCREEKILGASNFIFSKNRTGKDIFRFEIIESSDLSPVKKWASLRPKNMGFSQGANCGKFRLFAPRAQSVNLIFEKHSGEHSSIAMSMGSDDVWEITTEIDLDTQAYLYEVTHAFKGRNKSHFTKKILDPYAKACVGRDGPGLLITENKNESPTKDQFVAPEAKDMVIVEAHIRDLLQNAPYDLTDSERLGFEGLKKWLSSEDCYLRKLGVNTIELQPVQQFDARSKKEYHWGYMPVNYFSPAAEYSSCPTKSHQEFEDLIKALHEAGIAVVLDVVYNHMGIPNHLLNLDREIYLKTDSLGRLTNHSGCGNDLECEAGPVKQLIIDSLKYWVKHFKVDGFRFDLGELLGIELLKEIETELRELNPRIVLIAEPWSFRGRLPEKMNQTGYSLWSDRCRESLLSFVKGEGDQIENISALIKGKLDHENLFPWQSIHYNESHDDYAFIDRIATGVPNGGMQPNQTAVKEAQLAMAILLLSPGIPMISAGQDFLRSKKGIRNTYQNGDVNALDYRRLSQFENFATEIRSLIKFRLSTRGQFTRPSTFQDCYYENISMIENDTLGMKIRHKSSNEEFLFLCNPTKKKLLLSLPDDWKKKELIFPSSIEITETSYLEPSEYRLLVRKV